MRWPWSERRESSYTDALVAQLTSSATGSASAVSSATSALETCAGLVGRAFASATVEGPANMVAALDPATLSMIGRSFIRRGEIVFRIEVDAGQVILQPAQSHSIDGGPDPRSWRYETTLSGPSRTHTYKRQSPEGIVHVRYACDPERPWRGYGPLQVALLAGRLSAQTAAALGDEASAPRGSFLATPKDGQDPTQAGLKADIKKGRGALLVVEAGDWDKAGGASAMWEQKRFGASPPAAMVELLGVASREVYTACGLSPAMFSETSAAAKEAWRQALHSVVQPLGSILQNELRNKIAPNISISFDRLMASDIQGRARAFQALMNGGMSADKAAGLSGLLERDD